MNKPPVDLKSGSASAGRHISLPLTIERLAGDAAAAAAERLEVPVSFASDAVIDDPWLGPTRLSFDAPAIDLSAAAERGIPVLEMHQRGLPIARLCAPISDGHRLKGTLRFSASARGRELYRDAVDGILTDLSVGAVIHDAVQLEDHLLATRWTPREVSLVDTGADQSVGINRTQHQPPMEARRMNNPANQSSAADPGSAAPAQPAAASATNQNDINIMELARYLENRAPELGIMRDAQDAVQFGRAFEAFRSEAWAKLEAHKKSNPPPAIAAPSPSELGLSRTESERFSICRAAIAAVTGDWRKAGFELEASRAIAERLNRPARGFFVPLEVQREMSAGSLTAGGALVGTEHRGDLLIEALRAKSVALTLGVRTLPGLVGNLSIPQTTGSATFQWLSEGEDVDESEMTFGAVSMGPRTIAGAVPMTRRLLQQSAPAAETLVREDLIAGCGLGIDYAIFRGAGVKDPLGVLNHPNINTVNVATDGSPTWAEVVQFETEIDTDNALFGEAAYVVAPGVMGTLKTTKKDAGSGIFLTDGATLNGYRLAKSAQLAANTVIFGCWSEVIVGFWGVMEVRPDEAKLAASGGLVLRVFQDADVVVRHGQAFCKGT